MCVCAYVCVISFFVMSDCFPSNKLELLLNLVRRLTPPHPQAGTYCELLGCWSVASSKGSLPLFSCLVMVLPLHSTIPYPLPQFANQVAGGRRPGGKGCQQVLAPLVLV